MNKISYFLSCRFDYESTISRACGPSYAASYDWDTKPLNLLSKSGSEICVIDNRISPDEMGIVMEAIRDSDKRILLKFHDPYLRNLNKPYFEFIFSLQPQNNLFFLSPYPPVELGEKIVERHGREKFLHIPYAYDRSREVNIPLEKRTKRLVLSGNLSPELYPFRARFRKESYRKLWSLFKVSYLPHCGYPDIGMKLKHEYFGNKYIDFLSNNFSMLVSPGRLGLEFLKYSECAYAGCVPVGQKPKAFSDLSNSSFFSINESNIRKSVENLFSTPLHELSEISLSYRVWMRKNRSSEKLNAKLLSEVSGD